MAEIPRYDSRIAPPSTTGEILDTTSAGLIAQKEIAKTRQWMGAANLAGAVADSASQIGDIYKRQNDLSQRAQMLSELQRADSDVVFQIDNLSRNTQFLNDWRYQEGGSPSEHLQNWIDARFNTLGQGLEGNYREEFELRLNEKMLKAGFEINKMATEHAYSTIAATHAKSATDNIENVNTDNLASHVATSVAEFNRNMTEEVQLGIRDPLEAEALMQQNEEALWSQSIFTAARDIQDGTVWTSIETGETYDGVSGALDMVDDYAEGGIISDAQRVRYREAIMDENTAKYARGNPIQDQYSQEAWNTLTGEMARGLRLSNEQLFDRTERARTPEYTETYNTRGDRTLLNSLIAYQKRLDSGTGEDTGYSYPTIVADKWMDTTIDQDNFQPWVRDNNDYLGIPQDEIFKLFAKTKPTMDQLSNSNLNRAVNDAFDPIIDSFDDSDKDKEDKLYWEQLKNNSVFYLADRAATDEMNTPEKVNEMLQNILRVQLNESVSRTYEANDRKENDAERMGGLLQLGYARGISDMTPELAASIARTQETQHLITQRTYGVDDTGRSNVLEIVQGTRGSAFEGRAVFKVRDPYDDNRLKWILYDVETDESGRVEEVARELAIDEHDDAIGEVWTLSAAQALADDARPGLFDDIDISPVDSGPRRTVDSMNQWYHENSNASFIPLEKVNEYLGTTYSSPEETQAFFNNIYQTALPAMKFHLTSANEAGRLGIFNARGNLSRNAGAVMAERISAYGLPADYVSQALRDIFGVE